MRSTIQLIGGPADARGEQQDTPLGPPEVIVEVAGVGHVYRPADPPRVSPDGVELYVWAGPR